MSDIVKRLRDWCTDWDGSAMVPGEPPRDGLHCDILLEAADEIDRERQRNASLIEEAANVAYRICAETRHVTLGDKAAAAIRALAPKEGEE